jgi:hypothetical protein
MFSYFHFVQLRPKLLAFSYEPSMLTGVASGTERAPQAKEAPPGDLHCRIDGKVRYGTLVSFVPRHLDVATYTPRLTPTTDTHTSNKVQ